MSEESRPGRRMKPVAADLPPLRRVFTLHLRELVELSLPEGTPAGVLAPLVPMARSTLFHYLSGNRLPSPGVLESLLDVLWTVKTHPETLQLPDDEVEGGIERLAAPPEKVAGWLRMLERAEAEEPHSTRAAGRIPLRVAQSRTSTNRDSETAAALADAALSQRARSDLSSVFQAYRPGPAEGSMSVAEALRAVREAQRGVQEATAQLGRAQDRLAQALVDEGRLTPEALDDDLVSLKQRFDAFRDRHEVAGARQRTQLLLTHAERLQREDGLTEAARQRAGRSAERLRDLYERLDRADAEPDGEARHRELQEVYRLLEEREKAASIRQAAP
ncbi:hypothetical protein ABT234_12060 [Streptomyces sp. NPDC001586]|uniref:hypothetical protein n=1 Tax=Streptomyces sp. NPDC001586 TaxID=3154387 RepID=UPI00332BDEF8